MAVKTADRADRADRQDQLQRLTAGACAAADLLKLLAHEGRLLILCHLAVEGELNAGALAQRVGLSQSALSQHLAKMLEAGVVLRRRESQTMYYRIGDPKAARILESLKQIYCP